MKKQEISNQKTSKKSPATEENAFLTKEYLEIKKIIKDLIDFIEGVKKKKYEKSDLYNLQDRLQRISTSIFVNVDTYQHQKIMDSRVLLMADPITYYNSLKEAQTLAMESDNCEGMSDCTMYIELLRSYFLKMHLLEVERIQSKK